MTWPRCALALILAVLAAACGPATGALDLPAVTFKAPKTLRVRVTEGGRTVLKRVALEDYVEATIISEYAPEAAQAEGVDGMLAVQAVISRTYAIANLNRHAREGFDLCDSTHCQLYQPSRLRTSRWAAAAAGAVRRTASAVLWFGAAPASALFHADCGGRTSDAADVWGGPPRPYLVGRRDDLPSVTHATWTHLEKRDALRAALNVDVRTRVGKRLDAIEVMTRDKAGRATTIALAGEQRRTVRGVVFREVLARTLGARAVKSTRFDVKREGASYRFEGRGFGHGVGLCQAGALARIRGGDSVADVLMQYYPRTKLVVLAR